MIPAIQIVLAWALGFGLAAAEPATQPAAAVDESALLDQLVADWDAYGLPSPPTEAWPAVGEDYIDSFSNGVRQHPYSLVFAVGPSAAEVKAIYTPMGEPIGAGDFDTKLRMETIEALDPGGANLREARPRGSWMAVAVQCRRRRIDEVAKLALSRVVAYEADRRSRHYRIDPDRPVEHRKIVSRMAWNHWHGQLTEPRNDGRAILDRLKQSLRPPHGLDGEAEREFVAALEQSLAPSHAAAEPFEATLDELVSLTSDNGINIFDQGYHKEQEDLSEIDPRYRRLWLAGFDAVPALMARLDDRRPTRCHLRYALGPGDVEYLRIGQIAAQTLVDLSAGALKMRNLGPGRGWGLERGDVDGWWQAAQAQGEETYLLAKLFPPPKEQPQYPSDSIRSRMADNPNIPAHIRERMRKMDDEMEESNKRGRREACQARAHLLHIIAAKYPHRLEEIYQQSQERCPESSHFLISALLAKGAKTKEQKAAHLLPRATSASSDARRVAIASLLEIRHERAVPLLVEALDLIPRQWETGMHKEGQSWAHLVITADDERAWKKLEQVLRACDVGQRLEILDVMACCEGFCPHAASRMALVRRFLNDDEVRDLKPDSRLRYGGFMAASGVDRVAVRDYAAFVLAGALAMGEMKYPDDEAGWAALRVAVEAELARRDAEKKP